MIKDNEFACDELLEWSDWGEWEPDGNLQEVTKDTTLTSIFNHGNIRKSTTDIPLQRNTHFKQRFNEAKGYYYRFWNHKLHLLGNLL